MPLPFRIGPRDVGPGCPTYIVAELSANHQGSFDNACELVRVAAASGADAVKLQTYTADTITIPSRSEPFRIQSGTLWDGTTLHELYQQAYTPWDWQPKLKALAESLGLACFSTPFDDTAVDFLLGIDVPAWKIASFELVDLPLIRRVARTGRPLVMSTGMASLDEIGEAVLTARQAGAVDLALLVCSSSYPSPPSAIRLARIRDLAERFDVVTGLSDHTLGIEVAVAAVALGASLVEKHFCLSRNDPGPDSAFSLEPAELKQLVASIRNAEAAVGHPVYGPAPDERKSLQFRRSLFVTAPIRRGDALTTANVRAIRPSHGLHTRHLEEVLGRRAARDLEAGTPLAWDLLEPDP
jgi:N-acetylneuraminate synthase